MSKIILGIHGLGNKPSKKLLEKWWKEALEEGLKAIGHPRRLSHFTLVYWANFLHPEPLNPHVRDKNNPLYIENPYIPARTHPQKKTRTLRKKVLDYIERQLAKIILNEDFSINYTSVTDLIIRRYFRDLDTYYSKPCRDRQDAMCRAQDVIRGDLSRVLRKYRTKDILLVAHSMGSIIAYDVLTQSVPDIRIHTLVTMGSPLGVPPVMLKILSEQRKKPQKHLTSRTPENIVHAWYNFSDPRDKVATDYNLSDDYEANSRHIRASDAIVTNNYEYQGDPNPHNVYGYLRTPEMARVIYNFLHYGKPNPRIWLSDVLTEAVKKSISDNAGNLYVSSISNYEIAMKTKNGNIGLPLSTDVWINEALRLHGIEEIPINRHIAVKSVSLPDIHNDPFDRIIIATAVIHQMPVITQNSIFRQYPDVHIIWE